MTALRPKTLLKGGTYRIEHKLGQGGFGITYLAKHLVLHRKVAVKEFFMEKLCNRDADTLMVSVGSIGSVASVERFKEKFLKEARLIASMDNQHIVRVFDAFEENGTAYYVMEYLDNGSLDNKLSHVAFSEATAMKFTRQIAEALAYIHNMNVLHLDVKPANILLRKNGDAVLIDFGISKRYDEDGGQTSTTPTGISEGYAPLEQYNQGMQVFTPCTDIYSLGATMYKMITGQTPPKSSIVNEEGLPSKPNTITNATWSAVVKAMCPKRQDRPQSIDDFLTLLGSVTHDHVDDTEEDEDTVVESEEKQIYPEPIVNADSLQFDVKGVKFKMIKVEGGTFEMRERVTVKSGFLGLDTKVTNIEQTTTLNDYFIGETQVTQALWTAVIGKNPSYFKGDFKPVESVSWDDCQMFIQKLDEITGKNFRLPSEAEWEFAARGGNKSKNYHFSGNNDTEKVAWNETNSSVSTHNVATKEPNELGLYDMSGNVSEWCYDWYGDYLNGVVADPRGNKKGSIRVCRGGNWDSESMACEITSRLAFTPNKRTSVLGLRLALSPSE